MFKNGEKTGGGGSWYFGSVLKLGRSLSLLCVPQPILVVPFCHSVDYSGPFSYTYTLSIFSVSLLNRDVTTLHMRYFNKTSTRVHVDISLTG